MPVVEKIRLEIVSKEDLRKLEEDVVFIEGLSKRKDTASARVKRRKQGVGGAFGQDPNDTSLPSSVIKKRKQEELQRIIKPKGGKLGDKLLAGTGAPIQRNVVFKNLVKKVSTLEASQVKSQRALGFAMQAIGLGRGGLGGISQMMIGTVGKIFFPIAIATTIAAVVFQMWKASYGRGGQNDASKLQLDSAVSFIGLERETSILGGERLFLGDTTLRQGLPKGRSNTAELRFGARQYVLRTNPYGR